MATRTEKVAGRIVGRVGKGSKAAAGASRRISKALDRVADMSERLNSPRKLRKTTRTLVSAAKAAAAGAVARGVRRAARYAEEKADALDAPQRRRSRIKTAAKVAGAAAVVAGAVVLARRARKK